MNHKKELFCVFHPYVKPGNKRPFRYKAVSANRLPDYIGKFKAETEVKKFLLSGEDKTDFYVSLKGKVYLYRK